MRRVYSGFKLVITISLILVLTLSMSVNNGPAEDSVVAIFNSPIRVNELSWTKSGLINITNNDDFDLQGFPGSGIAEDPYRIENLSIVADGDCISVNNTTAHFIISNCYFGSEHPEFDSIFNFAAVAGVILRNVSNCRIVNCRFQYKYYGCFLWHLTSSCSITDSLFEDCFRYGVFTVASSNGRVSENTFSRNFIGVGLHGGGGWGSTHFFNVSYNTFRQNGYGIDCNSAASIIDHNTFESGEIGIYGWHNNATITNNQIDSMSSLGIEIGSGSSGLIQFNQITNIDGNGITVLGCSNLTVSHNLIEHCTYGIDAWGKFLIFEWNNISFHSRGFELQSASDCIIRNNIISNGDGYGIFFGGVSNTSVYYNTFINNEYRHAGNIGENNTWDDGVGRGNVWDDYIGFGMYAIYGSAGSIDRYPDNPEHGLQFHVILPPIVIGSICVIGIILLYQKRNLIGARLKRS